MSLRIPQSLVRTLIRCTQFRRFAQFSYAPLYTLIQPFTPFCTKFCRFTPNYDNCMHPCAPLCILMQPVPPPRPKLGWRYTPVCPSSYASCSAASLQTMLAGCTRTTRPYAPLCTLMHRFPPFRDAPVCTLLCTLMDPIPSSHLRRSACVVLCSFRSCSSLFLLLASLRLVRCSLPCGAGCVICFCSISSRSCQFLRCERHFDPAPPPPTKSRRKVYSGGIFKVITIAASVHTPVGTVVHPYASSSSLSPHPLMA